MGSFDPLADIITQRCEEHNWSGVLQSCPRCAERREHQDQIRQEERIQTNLLREANARAESERSRHERHEVVRQREQHEREWADKRALQDARWEEEERLRKAREEELDHRQWVEEREDLHSHTPIEMTSCPCCGQPYASKRTVHKPFACHWVGRLEQFIHEGVCPECHWKRENAKEEVPWTQADWSSYYFLQISKAKTTDAILALIARVRPSGNDAIMLDARTHLSASLITDIGKEKEIIRSAVSLDELEKHEATINKYALQLENECKMRVSVEYQTELRNIIFAKREEFRQIQERQQQDAELARQQSALKQKQKDALSKVESARREFLNCQADLASTESETISNCIKTSAILGMIGFFCGGFYGCVASGTTMLASGIKLGGIISLVSLFIFIVEAFSFGRVAKARSRVRYTRRALDQAQFSLGRDIDTKQDAKLEYAIDNINSDREDSFSNVKILRSIAIVISCGIVAMITFSVWLSIVRDSHQEINKSNDNLSDGAKRNSTTLSSSRYFRNDLYELLHTLPAFVGASSVAKSPNLSVKSMLDGNLLTAWNSRSGDTIGTMIIFEVPAYASVKRMKLTAGFTKSTVTKDLFLENHRILKIEIYRNGISIGQHMLNTNSRELQSVEIGTHGGKFQIVIKNTVPGSNRAWREVCISELEVWGQIPNDRPIVIQEPTIL